MGEEEIRVRSEETSVAVSAVTEATVRQREENCGATPIRKRRTSTRHWKDRTGPLIPSTGMFRTTTARVGAVVSDSVATVIPSGRNSAKLFPGMEQKNEQRGKRGSS